MLEALRGAVDVRDALARLKLDWPRAMVLVSSRAGTNVSSGLTEGSNPPIAIPPITVMAAAIILDERILASAFDATMVTRLGGQEKVRDASDQRLP
jgi:hypothetical protein